MFTFQSKKRLMSADPRLVVERTISRPGTLFMASSMGRVTVTCIWSIGATPLSTPSAMRGKSVDGKTAIGMLNARYTPIPMRVMMTKMMGREKRAVQCSCSGNSGMLFVVFVYFFNLGEDLDLRLVVETEAARRRSPSRLP